MYEPYPVPELAREHKKTRYSSLWGFAKQDLRLLAFFLLIASLIGFGVGYWLELARVGVGIGGIEGWRVLVLNAPDNCGSP